jgi:hypothetical protein
LIKASLHVHHSLGRDREVPGLIVVAWWITTSIPSRQPAPVDCATVVPSWGHQCQCISTRAYEAKPLVATNACATICAVAVVVVDGIGDSTPAVTHSGVRLAALRV